MIDEIIMLHPTTGELRSCSHYVVMQAGGGPKDFRPADAIDQQEWAAILNKHKEDLSVWLPLWEHYDKLYGN